MDYYQIAQLLIKECIDASYKFGAFSSSHEGWGVIREEYLELEDEIRKNPFDMEKMRHEAIQLGAMAIRFIYDICNEDKKWEI